MNSKGYRPGTLHWHRRGHPYDNPSTSYCVAEWDGSQFIFFNRDFEARSGLDFPHGEWEYVCPVFPPGE